VLGARPRTLPAAVVPVLVGTACAWEAAGERHAQVDWLNVVLAMIVALALQVATNYANDYSDGKRGTDDPSKRVGPPRLVGNGLATADEVKSAMLLAFGVSGLAGGVLALRVGWELIPVGVAAILAGYLYTGGPKPYGYLGLGEAFVFVFFGVVATVGSTYVQVERVTWLSVGCSVMVGSLATALLVVNNLRDMRAGNASVPGVAVRCRARGATCGESRVRCHHGRGQTGAGGAGRREGPGVDPGSRSDGQGADGFRGAPHCWTDHLHLHLIP